MAERQFDTLKITGIDSLYSNVYDDPTYKEAERNVLNDYDYLQKEIADYNYERNVLRGTGINKGIIVLYQDRVRDGMSLIKELKDNYIPQFVGFKCTARIKYKTNYGDSIAVLYVVLNKNLEEVQGSRLMHPWPSSASLDSLEKMMMGPMHFSWIERVDTTTFLRLKNNK